MQRPLPLLALCLALSPCVAGPLAVAADAPAPVPVPTPETPATEARLVLEFRGARLGQVLDYLSKEAGFVIINPIELPNPITLVAKQALTPAQAIDALNSVLLDQGYTAVVRGKTLRVVTLAAAKLQNLPVAVGSNPEKMPEGDRLVTQVIPVRFAAAKDLAENLTPLINTTYATMSANESSNTLILTDTEANVRRIASIVHAIDGAISGEQEVKVLHLAHASAEQVAKVINEIYGDKSGSKGGNGSQDIFRQLQGGGRGGFGGNGGGGQSGSTGTSQATHGEQVAAAADAGTNSVVLRAAPATLVPLEKMVQDLDVDTTAREGVMVYPVRNGKAADFAKALNDLFSGTTSSSSSGSQQTQNRVQGNNANNGRGGNNPLAALTGSATASGGSGNGASGEGADLSGKVKVVADETSNNVLVLTQERNFARVKEILSSLDTALPQVLVRVLVAEVTLEDGRELGVQLEAFNPKGSTTETRAFSDFGLFDSSSLGLNGFLLDSTHFRAAIRALDSTNRLDVLSRPYILTVDNREATVNVTQEVPIVTSTRTDTNNNVTNSFERRDVGIILKVTPQINSDGLVVLDVNQELSALTDQNIPVAKDVTTPIINKRNMTTRVGVQSGQTVIIGGLVSDSLTETIRKVPLLGDIPGLGELFKSRSKSKKKTELLVFLTPMVIQKPADLADLSRQLRSEMQRMDQAVEPGLLQRHLDQLAGLKVGESLPPPKAGGDQ